MNYFWMEIESKRFVPSSFLSHQIRITSLTFPEKAVIIQFVKLSQSLPFPFQNCRHIWFPFNLLYYLQHCPRCVVDVHFISYWWKLTRNWHRYGRYINRKHTSNIKYCWRLVPCVQTIKLFHHNIHTNTHDDDDIWTVSTQTLQ